jgi:hypothetical protein
VVALALSLSGAARAAEGEGYMAELDPLNSSEASGHAKVMVDGNQLKVMIESHGHSVDLPHAQHIHFGEEARHECPTIEDDEDGDNFVNTAEGQPAYGPVQVSLTTEGDVSPESGLAVDRFPVGESDGKVHYTRTFDVPENFSVEDLEDAVIVQHGISELFENQAAYDGEPRSSLDPNLPLEATIPATCGPLEMMGGMPNTGAGGASNTGVPVMGLALVGAVLAGGALMVVRPRGV